MPVTPKTTTRRAAGDNGDRANERAAAKLPAAPPATVGSGFSPFGGESLYTSGGLADRLTIEVESLFAGVGAALN